jgi:hypothetical protein
MITIDNYIEIEKMSEAIYNSQRYIVSIEINSTIQFVGFCSQVRLNVKNYMLWKIEQNASLPRIFDIQQEKNSLIEDPQLQPLWTESQWKENRQRLCKSCWAFVLCMAEYVVISCWCRLGLAKPPQTTNYPVIKSNFIRCNPICTFNSIHCYHLQIH